LPITEPVIVGQARLKEEYARRFANPALRAEILQSFEMGNKVIEHERVYGVLAEPVDAVSVYELKDGLIQTVWFHFAGEGSPLPTS
jgi:hypothetical protein